MSKNTPSLAQLATAQQSIANSTQAQVSTTYSVPTLGNYSVSIGGVNIVANSSMNPGHVWYSSASIVPDKSLLSKFNDNDIMEEYLKRFSPLGKALQEGE